MSQIATLHGHTFDLDSFLRKTTIIVGGPRTGKSSLARLIRQRLHIPTYCGDPESAVKETERGVWYLPEGLGFGSEATQYIIDFWLDDPADKVLEGHNMARVIRKWIEQNDAAKRPWDRVIVFSTQHEPAVTMKGQRSLHTGTMSVWREIAALVPEAEVWT